MLAKIKIRNKILILFTLFALVLLSTTVVYFYIQGTNYVKSQAVIKSEHYASQFENILKEEIKHSVIEIAGLRTQLLFIAADSINIPPAAFIDAAETFLHTYSNKYSSITIFNKNLDSVIRLSPIRLFTGDLSVQKNVGSIHELNIHIPVKPVEDFTGNEKVFSNVSRADPGIYIVSTVDEETGWSILFNLRLDTIADKGIQTINLDREATIAIYDNSGTTVFCNEKKFIHKIVSQLIDAENHPFIYDTENSHLIESSSVFVKNWMEMINSTLLVKLDITPSVEKLNSLVLQAILFVFVFFSIVTAVVFTISDRISQSISKMAKVADNVAAGNLDQKIEISRKDELGVLINSFNQMVENLKSSYQKLRFTNTELEGKIAELTTTKAILSEKERLAVIGETVSKISHEIQNKIGGVSIWIQNLEMQYPDDETAQMYINEIKNTLNSFLYMLFNFKKFYRIPQLNRSSTDLRTLIENVVKIFKSDSEKKRVAIVPDVENDVPKLSLDPLLIEEVILNVLINSAYYSPEHGVINVRCVHTGGAVVIEITDEGPGIDEEIAGKIFQPFFTTKSSGSGLGLAIVKNIIEAHSGSITVSNSETGGACVRIKLPITTTQLSPDQPNENPRSR